MIRASLAGMANLTSSEKARALAEGMDEANDGGDFQVHDDLSADARTWALVSIAESLYAIAERGIEAFTLDADGHRR